MKKALALCLALLMSLSVFSACASTQNASDAQAEVVQSASTEAPAASAAEDTAKNARIFTDSSKREVEIPAQITKYAVSGPLAQIVLFALAPDQMVGVATQWDKTAEAYLSDKYYQLPVLGQLYGGKGEMNFEELLASGAQIVIDVGEPKKTIVEDMDALQEQTGIPFVHIDAYTAQMGECYRTLGDLLGLEESAQTLASYCEKVYSRAEAITAGAQQQSALYITGEENHNVIAKGSYHAEVIDMFVNNLAEVDEPFSKGTGNEVDMEQILKWNPELILFAPESDYAGVSEDPAYQKLDAVKSGNYYQVPFGPYNWMGFPPSVQRYLGILWMGTLLYPDRCDYDLESEVKEYYQLFYHCELTSEQYASLVENSIGKVETQKAA